MILPLLMGGLGAVSSVLGGVGGTATGAGDIFGKVSGALTRVFGSKKAKKKQREANRAARAAAGEPTTGSLGEAGAQGAAGPAGIAGGGDRQTAATNALTALITGQSDKMVRAYAHQGRANKNDVLTLLGALDSVDISSAEGAQQRQLGVSDKILLSNEVERIFRTRRTRGGVPKSLVRLINQVRYVRKMLGVASSVASFGRKKGR